MVEAFGSAVLKAMPPRESGGILLPKEDHRALRKLYWASRGVKMGKKQSSAYRSVFVKQMTAIDEVQNRLLELLEDNSKATSEDFAETVNTLTVALQTLFQMVEGMADSCEIEWVPDHDE